MNAYLKIRLKLFFIDLLFELFVNSIILLIAFLSNKIIEVLSFYFAWRVFRTAVPKIFHIRHNNPFIALIGCAFCSIMCYFVAIRLMFPINISLLSSVIVGIFINIVLYKFQENVDLEKTKATSLYQLCKMTEEELRAYAISKGLSEMLVDTLVLRVLHNYRWVEIRKERNYSRSGIDYHKKTIENKLKIKL